VPEKYKMPIFETGLRFLSSNDGVLKKLIAVTNPVQIKKDDFDVASLVKVIINQQLSGKIADTIYKRLLVITKNNVNIETISNITDFELRAIGISNSKIAYIRGIQSTLIKDSSFLAKLKNTNAEDAFQKLCALKGIGPWSASIILMFNLNHPDIMPNNDNTLNSAIYFLYNSTDLVAISKAWKPYRTVACMCLWQWHDKGRPSLNDEI